MIINFDFILDVLYYFADLSLDVLEGVSLCDCVHSPWLFTIFT